MISETWQQNVLAAAAAEEARTKQRETYNTKVRGGIVRVGHRVLVKIVSLDGKHKLADKWEQEPYTVIAQPNEDIPVFTVRKENGEGRTRTLHRISYLQLVSSTILHLHQLQGKQGQSQ